MLSSMPITRIAVLACALGIRVAAPQAPPAHQTAPPPEQRVDINRASFQELLTVPGMTKSWAGRIMRFRPYRSKQDLVDRGIVSAEVYSRIKDFVIAHRAKP